MSAGKDSDPHLASLKYDSANLIFRLRSIADDHVKDSGDLWLANVCCQAADKIAQLESAVAAEREKVRVLRDALTRCAKWGISSRNYCSGESAAMADWVNGGMVGEPPPKQEFIRELETEGRA